VGGVAVAIGEGALERRGPAAIPPGYSSLLSGGSIMLFQTNLRKLEVVHAVGIIAFVAMALAAVPVAGAEVVGEDENVVSERGERWFFAHGVLVSPVVPETTAGLEDCTADGAVSVGAGEGVRSPGCPEYVMGDDFKEYDYGENGIGVTMCKLDGTVTETISGGLSLISTIGRYLGLEGEGSVSRTTTICVYHGCDLRITEAEANHSVRT
jgi:hypothetical protein